MCWLDHSGEFVRQSLSITQPLHESIHDTCTSFYDGLLSDANNKLIFICIDQQSLENILVSPPLTYSFWCKFPQALTALVAAPKQQELLGDHPDRQEHYWVKVPLERERERERERDPRSSGTEHRKLSVHDMTAVPRIIDLRSISRLCFRSIIQ